MTNKSGDVLLLAGKISDNTDNLELLEKQRENLASMIIHDLKNPLQAQISGLELLVKGTFGLLNHSQREIINLTINSAKYMQALIYDILLAFKSEDGKLVLTPENFDIAELVNNVIKDNRFLADEKLIQINCVSKIPSNSNDISADKKIIRRVIENIVNNSITYANKASQIKIELTKKSDMIEFNIGTESPEIPSEIANKIFEKYSGNNTCNKFNTGLGLYFCKLAIEAHGGKIALKTGKNYNVFTFKIPTKTHLLSK